MKTQLQAINPYMQHCVRVTLSNLETLPDTILTLPASYVSSLPVVGEGVDIHVIEKGTPLIPEECIRLNVVVVQERPSGDGHWEHCLSVGGNVNSVILDQRLTPDTACVITIAHSK